MGFFADRCIFTATAGGTGDFTESAAVAGFQTMENAGCISGQLYSYVAQATDLSQWEVGIGTFTTSNLARTTVLFNSLNTTAKINFTNAPQVLLTALGEDLRARITANTTFYIRSGGSDSNNGLSTGTAWLTIAHAFDYFDNNVETVIPGTGQITLDIGAGTFAGGFFIQNFSSFNGSTFVIQGASTATTTVTDGFVFGNSLFVNITIQTLAMAGVGSGSLLGVPPGTFIVVTSAKFDMGAIYNGLGCCELTGGSCNINNTEITGNGDFVIYSHGGGNGTIDTLTYTGTTSFVDAVMRINFDGNCNDFLGHTGTATGYKYTAEGNLWFPFGGGAIQSGVGTLDGIINPSGAVFTGTDFHHKITHTQSPGGVYNYQTPVTGFSLTLTDTDFHTIIDPSGTLATGTITMSPAPIDGQSMDIRFSQIITALTISPNSGQSVVGAPSTTAVGQVISAIYRTSNTTWYF